MRIALLALPLAGVILLGPTGARAATLRVPVDHASISQAVGAAVAGDTIQVQAGVYAEHVVLATNLVLLGGYDASFSTRDPLVNVTVIHGSGTGAAITANSLSSQAVVDGFKLSGGGGSPGGAVVVHGGSPKFTNNLIAGNHQAGAAGGVFIDGGSTARFQGNEIKNSSSAGGGGAFHIELSSPILIQNDIHDNVAATGGGAIYAFQSAVYCSANTFTDNTAGSGGGGAIQIQSFAATRARIVDCSFDGCRGLTGGAVLIRDEALVDLVNCDFTNCRAEVTGSPSSRAPSGGGLSVLGFSNVTAVDLRFDACEAVGANSRGGAIFLEASGGTFSATADPSETASSFITNCSADFGGAIAARTASGTIGDFLIDNCTARTSGGGIHLIYCTTTIRENILSACSAPAGGGAFVSDDRINSQQVKFFNNTFVGCSASGGTGGGMSIVARANKNVVLLSGNLISHTVSGSCMDCPVLAGEGSGARPIVRCTTVFQNPGNADPPVATGNCSVGFSSGPNNRIGDPLFCAGNVFQLQSCSPDVGQSCTTELPGRTNRGATDLVCGCPFTTNLTPTSWGRVKASYR